MGTLARAGQRVMEALRPSAAKCARCETLGREVEALRNENGQLRASLAESRPPDIDLSGTVRFWRGLRGRGDGEA